MLFVGDRFLGGQRCTLGPCCVKVILSQCVSDRRHPGLIFRLIDPEPCHAHLLPTGLSRGKEPGGICVAIEIAVDLFD
jgi:hypothetical protein